MFFKISKHKHVYVIYVHAHISSLQIRTVNDIVLTNYFEIGDVEESK